MRVLIVEDEPRLSSTLAIGLRAEGFTVVEAANGVDGLWQATENDFDVVVLDIMLPGLNGYEVLRRMRAKSVWTPVLMLTAKDGEYDQTDAFDLGADDYLTKPFSFIVLVARLRALVRRSAPHQPPVLTAGSLSVDPGRRTVQRGDKALSLTPREFGLLEYLMRNKNVAVTKADILRNVYWQNGNTPYGLADQKLIKLLDGQQATNDQAERNRLAGEAQQIIIDEAYGIPVFELTTVLGLAKGVEGVRFDSYSRLQLHGAVAGSG